MFVCMMEGKTKIQIQKLRMSKGLAVKSLSISSTFFAGFMGRGHIATIVAAYMGELAAQIGQEV